MAPTPSTRHLLDGVEVPVPPLDGASPSPFSTAHPTPCDFHTGDNLQMRQARDVRSRALRLPIGVRQVRDEARVRRQVPPLQGVVRRPAAHRRRRAVAGAIAAGGFPRVLCVPFVRARRLLPRPRALALPRRHRRDGVLDTIAATACSRRVRVTPSPRRRKSKYT